MSGPWPSWLQSPRNLLAAGSLLIALLVAVPGLVATEQQEPVADPTPSATQSPREDPLLADPEDWLAAEPAASAADRAQEPDGALDCLVLPGRVVEIGSQTIGLIERVYVERGDQVEAGQVIVELEASVESAAVEVAKLRSTMEGAIGAREEAHSLSARRQERGTELFERSALSKDVHEELETQARVAELELLQAQENRQLASLQLHQARALLQRRSLRSPISGVVIDRTLSEGEIVDEETILKIAQIDPLRVDVLMPASRYGSVQKGMRAMVEPEFPVESSVIARVSIVDPVIDAASGTFSVRLDLPNPDGAIPGGLHCAVSFLDE